jgi:hypothetical protein
MLAILAYLTFQLLYDPVANSLVDVANLLPRRKRIGNFNVVFQGLCIAKRVPGETFESPLGNPAAIFIGLEASTSSGGFQSYVGVNATSVHKPEFCSCFFLETCLSL